MNSSAAIPERRRRCWAPGFAGYKVELHRVREAWLARLARAEANIRREADKHAEIEDLLGRWSVSVAKKQVAPIGLPYQDLDELFLEVFKAVFKPDYRFVAEDNFGLIEIARRFLSPKAALISDHVPFGEESFARAVVWIRENLSLAAVQKLISSASDSELLDGHRRWLACIKAAAWLAKITAAENGAIDLPTLGRQLAVVFGPYCMLALLYLAGHGAGPMMDATGEMVDEFCDRVPDPSPWVKEKVPDFPQERLADIWRSFDYGRLFKLSTPPAS